MGLAKVNHSIIKAQGSLGSFKCSLDRIKSPPTMVAGSWPSDATLHFFVKKGTLTEQDLHRGTVGMDEGVAESAQADLQKQII